jgi:hypothetical protein
MPNWSRYGYDIDGLDTTATSTNVCTLYANASTKNQTDGPGGIDNSFGENIVPLLAAVAPNPSAAANATFAQGQYTLMFDMTGLATTAGQTATGITGMIFPGVPFAQGPNAPGTVPTFTTADNWPLDPSYVTSSLSGTTLVPPVTAKETLVGAYVVNGEFVSGNPTNLTLTIPVSGVLLVLPIQHGTVTFLNGGSASLSGGIISGVIDAGELVNNIQSVAGNISTSFCSGATFAQVAKSILQAADIMDDGTNSAGTPCNGISIGIGFDADEIGQPQVVGTPAATKNPCADGG